MRDARELSGPNQPTDRCLSEWARCGRVGRGRDGTADGRFTLPGLVALLAVGARDRPREPLVAEANNPAVIVRALDEVGRRVGCRSGPTRPGRSSSS